MTFKKVTYFLSVLLLIVCYSATIPVLTVLHNHYAKGQSALPCFQASKKAAHSTTHPLFCAICFRVSTAQAFIGHTIHVDADLIHHPAFVAKAMRPVDIIRQQPFQGRAPPLQQA